MRKGQISSTLKGATSGETFLLRFGLRPVLDLAEYCLPVQNQKRIVLKMSNKCQKVQMGIVPSVKNSEELVFASPSSFFGPTGKEMHWGAIESLFRLETESKENMQNCAIFKTREMQTVRALFLSGWLDGSFIGIINHCGHQSFQF